MGAACWSPPPGRVGPPWGPRARVPSWGGFPVWGSRPGGAFSLPPPLGGALCGAPRVLAPLPGFGVAAGVGNDADDLFLQSLTGCRRFGSSFYFVKVFCSNSAFCLLCTQKTANRSIPIRPSTCRISHLITGSRVVAERPLHSTRSYIDPAGALGILNFSCRYVWT